MALRSHLEPQKPNLGILGSVANNNVPALARLKKCTTRDSFLRLTLDLEAVTEPHVHDVLRSALHGLGLSNLHTNPRDAHVAIRNGRALPMNNEA